MDSNTIRRSELRPILEDITKDPEQIFSVWCARRNPLYLRYSPENIEGEGKLAYIGDHSIISTHEFVGGKRGAEKIELEPAGSMRMMLCKRKFPGENGQHTPMKHWTPKGGECRVNARENNLFGPVAGMYNDQNKTHSNGQVMEGRYGQWRPWSFIALEGVSKIRNKGIEYSVVD